MSTDKIQVIHYDNRRCSFSESVDFKINNKTIPTPTFAPRIKNEDELNLYLDIKANYEPKQLSAYVIRLVDVNRTIQPRLKRAGQKNLLGESIDPNFDRSLKNDILLVDPALEYLYYYSMIDRLKSSYSISSVIRKYAENIIRIEDSHNQNQKTKQNSGLSWESRDAEHTNFWSCIYKDATSRMKLIRDTYIAELQSRADILIPPVPLITSPYLLNVALDINEKFRVLTSGKGDCADYFILKRQILRNDSVMDKIKSHVSESESHLTIFKIKDLDLTNPDYALERNAFKKLLEELFLVSQHEENKSFALFEAGYQAFPAALCSFAIVSTSPSLDREDRRATQGQPISEFANWYDPETMTMRNKDTLTTKVENNNEIFPCSCHACNIGIPLTKENNALKYNHRVREHFLFTRENEMHEVVDAIEKQNASMGFDKLLRSDLKMLVDVIPR